MSEKLKLYLDQMFNVKVADALRAEGRITEHCLPVHGPHYPSRLHDKLIAEAFSLTNNTEKNGSGYIRIRKELEAYRELTFGVEEIGGGVLGNLPNRMRK